MKIKHIIYTFITALVMLLAQSCSDVVDYNDGYDNELKSYGPPTIKMITTTTDVETAIDEAFVAEMISLHGENLTGIKSIFVNDLEVNLETVYAIRSKITFPIPRKLPMEIDNKVKLTTELGSVTVPLTVNIPDLIVDGFYNEFALDDDTTRIVGDFFDIYDITPELATVKLNGTEVDFIESGEDFMAIRIPIGAPKNSVLTVTSPRLENPLELKFRDEGYPILDVNNPGGTNGAWCDDDHLPYRYWTDGTNPGDPEPLGSNFFRFYGTYGQYNWVNVLYARFDMTDEDIINNPQDYYFKFEINNNAKTPLKPLIRVGRHQAAGLNFEWDPARFNNGLTLNTSGQWKTLTFELLDMFRNDNPDVRDKTNLELPENAADRNHFIIVYNPLEEGDADVSLTNFRIVKKY